jgi:hypothetical protein
MFDSFDIFRVDADGMAVWVKSVATLELACAEIKQFGASQPAEYVLFGQHAGRPISVGVIEQRLSSTAHPSRVN